MISFKQKQIIVFSLTFISYLLYHASRKNTSGVKDKIIDDWVNTTNFMTTREQALQFFSYLDTTFMIIYAGFLVYSGWLGDRLNPLYLVVFGMIGSAVSLFSFYYVPSYTNWYSKFYYIIGSAIFGLIQAFGWPNEITIMSNWFTGSNRGLVLGIWATCQSFGNIIGLIICYLCTDYTLSFLVNAGLILFFGIIMLIFVPQKPSENNLNYSNQLSTRLPTSEICLNENNEVRKKLTLLEAIKLPTVLQYCLCNACLKFVNYAIFFWLPIILFSSNQKGNTKDYANILACCFDLGGVLGSVVGGYVSDKIGKRSPIIMSLLVASVPLLIFYMKSASEIYKTVIFLTAIGVTISGPYNLIVGTISVDLGSQPAIAENTDAMSTVTGIIDATGSAGAALGQLIVPLIIKDISQNDNFFYLMIIMNVLSCLSLIKLFLRDCNKIWKQYTSG